MIDKAKIAGLILVALVAVIVVFQNTGRVETRFLFITVEMPQVVLLIATLLVGFAGGVFAAGRIARRRRKSQD